MEFNLEKEKPNYWRFERIYDIALAKAKKEDPLILLSSKNFKVVSHNRWNCENAFKIMMEICDESIDVPIFMSLKKVLYPNKFEEELNKENCKVRDFILYLLRG